MVTEVATPDMAGEVLVNQDAEDHLLPIGIPEYRHTMALPARHKTSSPPNPLKRPLQLTRRASLRLKSFPSPSSSSTQGL